MAATSSTRSRWPRPTVRVRLAAIYGALILGTGFALLTVVYLVLARSVAGKTAGVRTELSRKARIAGDDKIVQAVDQTGHDTLRNLLSISGASLAVFVVVALLVGWWMAGRVLAPVHQITATARDLSWQNLAERIRLRGPSDELKELADTFDAMLGRLEAAFTSQRRFIANASHELRTPLSIQRTIIQLGLDSPSPQQLAEVRCDLLETNRRSERLIDGLLLLAQCDGGLPAREPVALAGLIHEVLAEQSGFAAAAEVAVRSHVRDTTVDGDRVLLGRLVTNLVSNGIRYNYPSGVVEISAEPGLIVVTNTGPSVPADRVAGLFEPFVRLDDADRRDGAGLGLSIVRSIAHAHGGSVEARARPEGGLEVRVGCPVRSS
jgi:signal transduction histidine kinase